MPVPSLAGRVRDRAAWPAAAPCLALAACLDLGSAAAAPAADPTFGGRLSKVTCVARATTTCDGDYCTVELPAHPSGLGITIDFASRTFGMANGAVPKPMRDVAVSDGPPDGSVWVKFTSEDAGYVQHVWFTAGREGSGYRMGAGARSTAEADTGPLAGKPGLFSERAPATITEGYTCSPSP